MDILLLIIMCVFLFSIALLGMEERKPTKRQKINIKKWNDFKLQIIENHLNMFFVGCFILIAIILIALKIGGVL